MRVLNSSSSPNLIHQMIASALYFQAPSLLNFLIPAAWPFAAGTSLLIVHSQGHMYNEKYIHDMLGFLSSLILCQQHVGDAVAHPEASTWAHVS
jgi:hypothetical protein